MNRLFLFLIFSFATHLIFAQQKNFEKAKVEFKKYNLTGANKLIDKCLQHPDTKKDRRVRLLKSRIMYGIHLDKTLSAEFPDAFKEAIKYADYDVKEGILEVDHEFIYESKEIQNFFRAIRKTNTKEGMDAFNNDKFTKALPIFKKSLSLGLDTQALVMVGECYWQMKMRIESLPYFKKASRIIYDAVMDSTSKVLGYHKLPFRQLGKYYIDKQQFDTAYIIVKNGRDILPGDPILSEYTYKLMRFALEKIPPSGDYLSMVQQSLSDFPTDSFLNHRENSIYIFLLNGMAKANEQRQFDSLLMVFALSKEAKAKMKNLDLIRKFDIFAGQEKSTFLGNFYFYLSDIGLHEASYLAYKKYFNESRSGYGTADDNIFNKSKTPFYASILYAQAMKKNPGLAVKRDDYTLMINKSAVGYYDLLPLINLNDAGIKSRPKEISFKAKAREYRLRLMNESTDSNDFILARKIYNECLVLYPDLKKSLEVQWKKIIVKDFMVNYYGSRINPPGKKEAGVPEHKWKGDAERCVPGKMNDSLIGRLERRINYFRRMAGLTEEIVLTNENNENCEIAALMCEANKSMSHEPNDGWRCFIPAGVDALKLSILSRDGNPAIAITAAMGQNHTTAGNRRWLLYPYAQLMGVGTSHNYTSVLTIDNSNKTDTFKYKSQAVAWPPASYCPKMMIYKKWSFTLDRNLNGATVTMKNMKGENILLKLEPLAQGYGLNTLVWEPEINAQALADNDEFTVTVKLSNTKMYSYKVIIADIKL